MPSWEIAVLEFIGISIIGFIILAYKSEDSFLKTIFLGFAIGGVPLGAYIAKLAAEQNSANAATVSLLETFYIVTVFAFLILVVWLVLGLVSDTFKLFKFDKKEKSDDYKQFEEMRKQY